MSIRHLDSLFAPRSVAVIGATDRPHSVGATLWRNLHGHFKGDLYAVNPNRTELDGATVWPNLEALVAHTGKAPDLAVLCTPASTLLSLVTRLGCLGTKAVVVINESLSPELETALLQAAKPHNLRILGPNSVGVLVPHLGLNASFAPSNASSGPLAFVSQSGALVTPMLDWANAHGVGFSHLVSLGDSSDVDLGDMLDFLGSDSRTRAILLYIQSVQSPRKFMSAARAAARNKPVIVVKAGRSAEGQKAAASHTGSLAGADDVFDAAISRAGMLRVHTLFQLFTAAELLARFRDNRSPKLTILTNGGGAGIIAADAAADDGVTLSTLSPDSLERLDTLLPAGWSRHNPVDILGNAPPERYVAALQTLLQDHNSAVLLVQVPTAWSSSTEIAQALLPLARQRPPRVLSCWLGQDNVAEARQLFREAGVPNYDTPEQAVRAFAFLRTYQQHQIELMETPSADPLGGPADLARMRELVDFVLADGRNVLTEPEAKELLRLAGVPVTQTRVVPPEPEATVYAAETLGYPVVLKILSPDIVHKSDVGGVRLNLHNRTEVMTAAESMLERVRQRQPDARIEGFTVQPMVKRSHSHEVIVGASIDPMFGPVILFGAGGVEVEVVKDHAIGLPPLSTALAGSLIQKTRIAKLLQGYREVPAADHEAIVHVLLAVSQLLADIPEIAELDINPLVVNHEGALALDARVTLSRDCPAGRANFAIRAYPNHLVETLPWENGGKLTLRPIRPEDEARHLDFFNHSDPEDLRMRFFYARRSFEHTELARLTQIDYQREMAFVATVLNEQGQEETIGSVQGISDPNNDEAEFAVIVRSDMKGKHLGWILMDKLIRYLRANGTKRVVGTILKENNGMLDLARGLGFQVMRHPEDPDLRWVELPLQEGAPSGVSH